MQCNFEFIPSYLFQHFENFDGAYVPSYCAIWCVMLDDLMKRDWTSWKKKLMNYR